MKALDGSVRAIATLILALSAVSAAAAIPGMVKDIDVTIPARSSLPGYLGSTATQTFFTAEDSRGRPFLWRTDGTAAGTTQIVQMPWSSPIGRGVALGARQLLFLAGATPPGLGELWVTDGTASGTQRLAEPASYLGHTPSFVLFERWPLNGAPELWRSDGTPQGTFMLVTGLRFFSYAALGSVGVTASGKIYLIGTGQRLWVSDGTVVGTREAPMLGSVVDPRSITNLTAVNGGAYFRYAFAPPAPRTWWRVDATNDTVSTVTLPPGYETATAGTLVSTGNQAFFTTHSATTGAQLWRAEGLQNPVLLLQVDAAAGDITDLRAIGSRAVFAVRDATTLAKSLWTSDGTLPGTQQLVAMGEFIKGTREPDGSLTLLDDPSLFTAGAQGEVWSTDGTASGTGPLFTLSAGEQVSSMMYAGDRAYVATTTGRLVSARLSTRATEILSTTVNVAMEPAQTALAQSPFGVWFAAGGPQGVEPYVSNGTAAGTRLLRNIEAETTTGDSLPSDFIDLNGALYFSANDAVSGRELWRSDGTPGGTQLFADLVPGPEGSSPTQLFIGGGRLYFFTLQGTRTLWSTDGQSAPVRVGPVSVELAPGQGYSCPQPRMPSLGAYVYFPASSTGGTELWKSDGTEAGTSLAVELLAGPNGSQPCSIVELNNQLFFTAADSLQGRKLWRSDGTTAGTLAIATLSPSGSAFPSGPSFGPLVFGNALYFVAETENSGARLLWRSNGQAGGGSIVHEVAANQSLQLPVVIGNRLAFIITTYVAATNSISFELWTSDGSAAGTSLLSGRVGGEMLSAGSQLFFTRFDDATGAEPWRTDGSPAGTRLLQDVSPGPTSSSLTWFANFRGLGLFVVKDGNGAATMWRTDGTAAGTSSVAPFDDIVFERPLAPDDQPRPYIPAISTRFGVDLVTPVATADRLFFLGHDAVGGIELFALENERPVASDDAASVTGGATITINVLANDRDTDGSLDPASIRIVTQPAGGTATMNNGVVTYTARQEYSGTDSFTYVVADSQGRETAAARVSIDVTAAQRRSGRGGGGAFGIELLMLLLLLPSSLTLSRAGRRG